MRKPHDYVTELFHKLQEDISGIKHRLFTEQHNSESTAGNAPRHYVIDAIHAHDDAEDKNSDSIRATLNLPQSIRVDANTQERQKKWNRDRHYVVTCIGTFFAIVVAVIYFFQLQTMKKSMRVEQRPWLKISLETDQVQIGVPVHATAKFANGGRTPARAVHGEFCIEKVKNGEQARFNSCLPGIRYKAGTIYPQDPQQPVPVFKVAPDGITPEPLSVDDFRAFVGQDIFYVVYGTIHYSDFFGVDHWTNVCVPILPVVAQGHWTHQSCTDYGDVDTN